MIHAIIFFYHAIIKKCIIKGYNALLALNVNYLNIPAKIINNLLLMFYLRLYVGPTIIKGGKKQ